MCVLFSVSCFCAVWMEACTTQQMQEFSSVLLSNVGKLYITKSPTASCQCHSAKSGLKPHLQVLQHAAVQLNHLLVLLLLVSQRAQCIVLQALDCGVCAHKPQLELQGIAYIQGTPRSSINKAFNTSSQRSITTSLFKGGCSAQFIHVL